MLDTNTDEIWGNTVLKKYLQKGLMIFAGAVSLPCTVSHADSHLPKPECKSTDVRFQRLKKFFHDTKSPIEHLSAAFIVEADANHLDWRLLPGLSVVESGAGRAFRGNNLFGWNNGDSSFHSVREGIHFVAERLAHGRYYRGKTVAQKLSTYNPNDGYREKVQSVMARISFSEGL